MHLLQVVLSPAGYQRNRCAEGIDLNPCIFRSRLRMGKCEF
jgi:hypothetical protein